MINIGQVMVKDVVTVDVSTPLRDVFRIMGEKRIGSVVVTKDGRPIGIFTERDAFTKILSKNIDAAKGVVEEYMSTPLTAIRRDYDFKEAAKAMAHLHIRRLPVVEDGRLIGIVTSTDIVRALAEDPF